jgi:hypothetical protein
MERYRFHADGALFYVTFSVVDWLPVFVSETACKIVTDSLNFCHRTKGLRINAYVIMPTHLHGIFFHESFQAKPLEKVLTDFRKFTGRQLADFCREHLPPSFTQVFEQRAGDDRERRFWQPTRHPVQNPAILAGEVRLSPCQPLPEGPGFVAGILAFFLDQLLAARRRDCQRGGVDPGILVAGVCGEPKRRRPAVGRVGGVRRPAPSAVLRHCKSLASRIWKRRISSWRLARSSRACRCRVYRAWIRFASNS